MGSTNICYTGIGSLKNGNHTRKQFLDIMTKHFAKECTKSCKCNSCKKFNKQNSNELKKAVEASKKNKTYKISKRKVNSIKKLRLNCDKCLNKNTRKCSLKEYIKFSGAEVGKC